MVEVPSVALIADLAAEEVDFASVGTNDLTQYLCAADRLNPSVQDYYQAYHPAVFRVLAYLAKAFAQAGKDISVCGELGGDPLALPALIGLGLLQFSMGAASLAKAKQVIRSLRLSDAEVLAADVLQKRTHDEVEACLNAFLKKKES
jgi:phosphotransferase system enzyme I (PtsI)